MSKEKAKKRAHNFKDLTGQKFGWLTVIGISERNNNKKIFWDCVCDCGNHVTIVGNNLTNGHTKSCGCYNLQKLRERKTHGQTKTKLYRVWSNMKTRCYNDNVEAYKYYGGRGIRVCDEWLNSFTSFRDWAYENGYDETAERSKCTLDRIDNDGDYSPDNCRWVDSIEQARNKRTNRVVTVFGKDMTVSDAAVLYDIDPFVVYHRLDRGWSVDSALLTPIGAKNRKNDKGRLRLKQFIVDMGSIYTFPNAKADKIQALKIGEECMEVYSAYEQFMNASTRKELIQARANILNECADVLQAVANMVAALEVNDFTPYIEACERRNRERGRYE